MIKSLAYIIINPIFWLFFFGAAFFILKQIGKLKLSKVVGIVFWIWLFVIYISPLPQFLIHHLEYQYPNFKLPEHNTETPLNIIVLGGGSFHDPETSYNSRLSSSALSRLVEGIRIYNQADSAKLILSGYSASGRESVAEIMGKTAVILKVPAQDTLINVSPSNTEEEADFYSQRFGKKSKLILVTSAFHMPRAMAHFEKIGIQPIPAPTDYKVHLDDLKPPYNFKPSIEKLLFMQIAMKEYVALFWLKLKH